MGRPIETINTVTVPYARLTGNTLQIHGDERVTINLETATLTIPQLDETFGSPVVVPSTRKLALTPSLLKEFIEQGKPVKVFKSLKGDAIIYLRVRHRGIHVITMHPTFNAW